MVIPFIGIDFLWGTRQQWIGAISGNPRLELPVGVVNDSTAPLYRVDLNELYKIQNMAKPSKVETSVEVR